MRMYSLVQTCDSPSDMQSFQNHEPSRTQHITTTEQHSEISRRSSQTSDSSDDEYVNLKTPLYAVPNKMKKLWKSKDEKRASAHYENLPPVDDCRQEFFLFQQEQGHIASNSFPKLEDMHAVEKDGNHSISNHYVVISL
ncbi:uncharacterized protein [Ptychodera flava]|uniref:uncharacterized protein n=1 Tax=Ptychodera flava TaxID=63121 RepID=UPI00396A8496